MTDENGNHELLYIDNQKGALPGPHKVSISTFIESDPDSAAPLVEVGQREVVPAQYNTETTLTAELKPGARETVDFALRSS